MTAKYRTTFSVAAVEACPGRDRRFSALIERRYRRRYSEREPGGGSWRLSLTAPNPFTLARQVKKSRQASFPCNVVDAGEERLQAVKVGLALDFDQLRLAQGARVAPALGEDGGRLSNVVGAEQLQACLADEALILSGREKQVIPDRAARRHLLVRQRSGYDHGVGIQSATPPVAALDTTP